jgi:protein O-mannosyl-transferase
MIFAPARRLPVNEVERMAEEESPDSSPDQTSAQPPVKTPSAAPINAGDAPVDGQDAVDEIALPNPLVLGAIGLVLLAVVTFLPTLRGAATWLDDVSFSDNPFVQAANGISRFWTSADRAGRYQPMTLTSFWLGYRFFQDSLVPTHLTNVLLHAVVVLLLWTLLRRLNVTGAWFAAAIFAVHPVHTQAIAWISGRSVVLASMFYLSAMLVYLRFLGVNPRSEEKTLFTLPPEPERLWGLAFVLFLCAMLSDAGASVMFPLAVMLILWWKTDEVTLKQWLGLVPFLIAAAAGGAWAAWLQVTSPATRAIAAAFGNPPLSDVLCIRARAIGFYALKIVAPYPLMFDYPRWSNSLAMGSLIGLVLLVMVIAFWMMRSRIGRGPLTAILLLIITIIPVVALLDPPAIRYSFVADNRQYLASAVLIAAVSAIATSIVMNEQWKEKLNPAYCAGAVLVVLAILTFHQGTIYLSNASLWKHTISQNSESVLGDEGYADVLLSGGVFDTARGWYEKAQLIAPRDPRAAVGLGTVAAALGYDQQVSGQADLAATQQTAAEQYFRDAIKVDSDYKPAYVELAELLILKHDQRGAIDALTEAVRIDHDSLRLRLQLGGLLRRAGDLDKAEKVLTDLAQDAPNVSAVHSELGSVYMAEHDPKQALPEWQKALQLDPANTTVLLNFGALLASSGQTELAAKQFLAATIVNPQLVLAHVYLARVYSELGHRQDAKDQLTQALALAPKDPNVKAAYQRAVDDETKNGPGTSASSQPTSGPTTDSMAIAPATAP